MTLAFSQQINHRPTYFPEKIWAGIQDHEITTELSNYVNSKYYSGRELLIDKPKLHSIRVDSCNRWKAGNKIHFVINNRTKNRLQFAPILTVKSVQKLEILYKISPVKTCVYVFVDGKSLGRAVWENCQLVKCSDPILQLSQNDGFDSVNLFFEYFSENFKGNLIHWTDLRY